MTDGNDRGDDERHLGRFVDRVRRRGRARRNCQPGATVVVVKVAGGLQLVVEVVVVIVAGGLQLVEVG